MSDQLSHKLQELQKLEAEIAELRRAECACDVHDYELTRSDGQPTKLSDLFGAQDQLVFIHNMGFSCSYCTMWADGFSSMLPYLERKAAFVVASPDAPAAQASGKTKRSWQFDMVSMQGTSLNRDLGFETDEGGPMPGVSTLIKNEHGKMRRYSADHFGPGDKYCSVWNLFALLPDGEAANCSD